MLTYFRKYYYINNYKQTDFQSAELQSIIKMEVIVQILNFYVCNPNCLKLFKKKS